MSIRLLIVDDNANSVEMLEAALEQSGVEIFSSTDPEEALDLVYSKHPHIVLTDLVMPKLTGINLLDKIIEFDPSIDVLLMTAHYSTETAVEAIKKGATDYLNKPVTIPVLREKVGKLIAEARRRQRTSEIESELTATSQFEGIIGRNAQMAEVFSRIRRIAPHYRSVLVTGETGTGKDLVARALHALSPVATSGRYVVLNCSAVVETLFESELFGHVRGAFTGATQDKAGLFEYANGGTLFLDEIGDMPLATQAKLLRALQNQEIQRVGSLTSRKVDVRVIAATNKNLHDAIVRHEFREDLYYRLSMVEIRVPPLAERLDDLPLLQRFFLDRFSKLYKKPVRGFTPRAQIVLSRHSWPGNVRELENVIGNACMMVLGDMIDVSDLPEYLQSGRPMVQADPVMMPSLGGSDEDRIQALEDQEKQLIQRALESTGGNQSQAARALRIGRDALRYKIKKHGLG